MSEHKSSGLIISASGPPPGGVDLFQMENILRFSTEKYLDTVSGRMVVVGRHEDRLVIIPFEQQGNTLIPVTVHATTRQQINFRLKTGRFIYE
jgi:hypothetical protein